MSQIRIKRFSLSPAYLALTACLGCSVALAEGTAELGIQTGLAVETVLHLDILDASTEVIAWTGTGLVTVRQPEGTLLDTLASGGTLAPAEDVIGAYIIELSADQPDGGAWDLAVEISDVPQTGRLWSPRWQYLQGGYEQSSTLTGSLYAVVPAGSAEITAVVEIRMEGVVAFTLPVMALPGVDTDRLISEADIGQMRPAEGLAVYLNPPADAGYSTLAPSLSGIQINGGQHNQVLIGSEPLEVSFESDTEGQFHFICDLNSDTVFNLHGDEDFAAIGPVQTGSNTLYWNGTDNSGQPVPPGDYKCRVRVVTGAVMLEMDDVETAYPGIRMFGVDDGLSRAGLCMFWNDGNLTIDSVLMPNNLNGLENSGAIGVCSGTYGEEAAANENARAWGNFSELGRGNNAFLRTLVWLDEDTSEDLAVQVVLPDDIFGDGFESIVLPPNQLANPGLEQYSTGANPPYDPPESWLSFGTTVDPSVPVGYDQYATHAHDAPMYNPAEPDDESNLFPGYEDSRALVMRAPSIDAGDNNFKDTLGTVYQQFTDGTVPAGSKLTLSGWAYVSDIDPLGAGNQAYLVTKCFPNDFSAEYCGGGGGMKSTFITDATTTNTWLPFSVTVDSLDAEATKVQAGLEFEQCAPGPCANAAGSVYWDAIHFYWE